MQDSAVSQKKSIISRLSNDETEVLPLSLGTALGPIHDFKVDGLTKIVTTSVGKRIVIQTA
jgi:hypothetical protein